MAHCNTKQLYNYEIVKVYKLDSNFIQILLFDIKKVFSLKSQANGTSRSEILSVSYLVKGMF